jgi:hypothetical protein
VKAKMSIALASVSIATGLLAAGCGSNSSGSSTSPSPATGSTAASQQSGGGEVPSEAQAAATGDIPDNQTFLLFRNPTAGYSIRYPEGWARQGSGNDVTFQEKANAIHVAVRKGSAPSEVSAVHGVKALHKGDPTVRSQPPERLTLGGAPAVKIVYSQQSAPDPVTGKRLRLVVDRYEYGHNGEVAVLDLATPVGVDNVDAYRMISESFEWRG